MQRQTPRNTKGVPEEPKESSEAGARQPRFFAARTRPESHFVLHFVWHFVKRPTKGDKVKDKVGDKVIGSFP